jgi:hypothetical protein
MFVRSNPAAKTAGKPKAAPAVLKLVTTKAVNKETTATCAPKPASMTGPLPLSTSMSASCGSASTPKQL